MRLETNTSLVREVNMQNTVSFSLIFVTQYLLARIHYSTRAWCNFFVFIFVDLCYGCLFFRLGWRALLLHSNEIRMLFESLRNEDP